MKFKPKDRVYVKTVGANGTVVGILDEKHVFVQMDEPIEVENSASNFIKNYTKHMESSKEYLELKNLLTKLFEEKVELSTLNPGETFKIGDHDFIVLKQDIRAMQTMVISKEFVLKNVKFNEDVRDYNKSNIRKLIEDKIQPEIEKEVGADNIIEHEVDLTSVDMQSEFGSCKCKVRPITFDEAREFNNLLVNEELGDWWWTCTPWSTEKRGYKYSIAVVSPSGDVNGNLCNNNYGVRPVCILKSNIFVSKGE